MRYPTSNILNQLLGIRQKQAEIWEELLMLEMRILCQFLSPNFDDLERFISPVMPISMNNEQRNIRLKNERLRIIQEAKRQWLHLFMTTYEIKLQEYDLQYEQVLEELKSFVYVHSQETHVDIWNEINQCILSYTKQLKQDISRRISGLQRTLQRNHRRSSVGKKMIGVHLNRIWI